MLVSCIVWRRGKGQHTHWSALAQNAKDYNRFQNKVEKETDKWE